MDGPKKPRIATKKSKCLKCQLKIKGEPDFSKPQKKLKKSFTFLASFFYDYDYDYYEYSYLSLSVILMQQEFT